MPEDLNGSFFAGAAMAGSALSIHQQRLNQMLRDSQRREQELQNTASEGTGSIRKGQFARSKHKIFIEPVHPSVRMNDMDRYLLQRAMRDSLSEKQLHERYGPPVSRRRAFESTGRYTKEDLDEWFGNNG